MSNNLIIILTPQHLCDKPHRFIIYWLEVNLSTHLWERGLILWGVWFPNISIWIVWIDDCCSRAKCLHMIHDSYIEVCTSLVLRSSSWIDRSLRSFFHRRFMVFPILFIPFTTFTGPIARVTGWVSYLKQELKIFSEHLSSSRFWWVPCFSSVFYVYSRWLLFCFYLVIFIFCLDLLLSL
jgi:hypothetical protein